MLFYYIRHGDPIYSPDSLTPLGKRQAEAVAKRLSLYGVDEIFVSSSQRAKETAQPTCEILKKNFEELDWCNEGYAWQEFALEIEGKIQWCFQTDKFRKLFSTEKVRALQDRWYEAEEFKDTKFKEGTLRIQKASDLFFENLGYRHDRKEHIYLPIKSNKNRVALFAHQGFGMAFLSSLLDIPYPTFCTHFDLCHSSVTAIEFKETDGIVIPKVLTLSNDSHLYREGLPTKYNNGISF